MFVSSAPRRPPQRAARAMPFKRGSMSRTTIRRLAAAVMAATLAACGTPSVGPGYYRVERGDTVSKIARAHRQSVPSIVRWNNLTNPDAIEVGQVLRVA